MEPLDLRIISTYRQMVEEFHPDMVDKWPILSGYNLKYGRYLGWNIFLFEHTGNKIFLRVPFEHFSYNIIGFDDIANNLVTIRRRLTKYFRVTPKDSLLILNPRATNIKEELKIIMKQHESAIEVKEIANVSDKQMTPDAESKIITEGSSVIYHLQNTLPFLIKKISKTIKTFSIKKVAFQPEQDIAPQPVRGKLPQIGGNIASRTEQLEQNLSSHDVQSPSPTKGQIPLAQMEQKSSLYLEKSLSPKAEQAPVLKTEQTISSQAALVPKVYDNKISSHKKYFFDPNNERTEAEKEYSQKIRKLQEKLDYYKSKPSRLNRKSAAEIEKKIQAENCRWCTVQRLWSIEDQKTPHFGKKNVE